MAAVALAAATFLPLNHSNACCPGEPHEVRVLTVSKLQVGVAGHGAAVRQVEIGTVPTVVHLEWLPQSGFYSDVVRGSLSELRQSRGDFSVALDACISEDNYGGSLDDAEVPAEGDGFWYLVRADQRDGCPGGLDGSYDSARPPLAGDRDLEIISSGRGCHCFMADMGYGCYAW